MIQHMWNLYFYFCYFISTSSKFEFEPLLLLVLFSYLLMLFLHLLLLKLTYAFWLGMSYQQKNRSFNDQKQMTNHQTSNIRASGPGSFSQGGPTLHLDISLMRRNRTSIATTCDFSHINGTSSDTTIYTVNQLFCNQIRLYVQAPSTLTKCPLVMDERKEAWKAATPMVWVLEPATAMILTMALVSVVGVIWK